MLNFKLPDNLTTVTDFNLLRLKDCLDRLAAEVWQEHWSDLSKMRTSIEAEIKAREDDTEVELPILQSLMNELFR